MQIQARHLRERDIQFFFGDHEFRFLAPPYCLRLHFAQRIAEGEGGAVHDSGARGG